MQWGCAADTLRDAEAAVSLLYLLVRSEEAVQAFEAVGRASEDA